MQASSAVEASHGLAQLAHAGTKQAGIPVNAQRDLLEHFATQSAITNDSHFFIGQHEDG